MAVDSGATRDGFHRPAASPPRGPPGGLRRRGPSGLRRRPRPERGPRDERACDGSRRLERPAGLRWEERPGGSRRDERSGRHAAAPERPSNGDLHADPPVAGQPMGPPARDVAVPHTRAGPRRRTVRADAGPSRISGTGPARDTVERQVVRRRPSPMGTVTGRPERLPSAAARTAAAPVSPAPGPPVPPRTCPPNSKPRWRTPSRGGDVRTAAKPAEP